MKKFEHPFETGSCYDKIILKAYSSKIILFRRHMIPGN